MIDQGWVWGAAGDGDAVNMLAWGGEPERDLSQISMVSCNIEVWQGLYEGRSHDQIQWSLVRDQDRTIPIGSGINHQRQGEQHFDGPRVGYLPLEF